MASALSEKQKSADQRRDAELIRNRPREKPLDEMSDRAHRQWDHAKLLSVCTALLAIFTLIYSITAIFQWLSMREQARLMAQQLDVMRTDIESTKLNRSADLILKFDERLGKPPFPKIRSTIESGKPILKAHGGRFTADDLEGYIGIFDSLNDLYAKNMVNKELFYNEFSYDIEKAYDNQEIQSYLKDIRKEESDYFSGFDNLAKAMKAATAAGTYASVK